VGWWGCGAGREGGRAGALPVSHCWGSDFSVYFVLCLGLMLGTSFRPAPPLSFMLGLLGFFFFVFLICCFTFVSVSGLVLVAAHCGGAD